MSGMPKSERDELRRVVRGDFKSLREEITVRKAEMLADIEHRVAQRFEPHETALFEARTKMQEVIGRANQEIVVITAELQKHCDGYKIEVRPVWPPEIALKREQRTEMRRALIADLDARIVQAMARMNRQEVNLLKQLSVGALASDEAKEFLASIPSVAELVPVSRLAELEAQFVEEEPESHRDFKEWGE